MNVRLAAALHQVTHDPIELRVGHRELLDGAIDQVVEGRGLGLSLFVVATPFRYAATVCNLVKPRK